MNATASVLRARRKPAYVIVEPTQHWHVRGTTFYRDCVVKLADGSYRLYAIRDDLVDVAA